MGSVTPLRHARRADLRSYGEPFRFAMGGALAIGILLILGFLLLIAWNGIGTFWPGPIELLTLYHKYGVMPAGTVMTGPGFVTKDTAAQVIDLSAKGIR